MPWMIGSKEITDGAGDYLMKFQGAISGMYLL